MSGNFVVSGIVGVIKGAGLINSRACARDLLSRHVTAKKVISWEAAAVELNCVTNDSWHFEYW